MTATGKPKSSFLTLFLRGFQWTFLRSVGGMVVRVITLIILSRLLTPFDFGVVAVAISGRQGIRARVLNSMDMSPVPTRNSRLTSAS